jgi:hypothetical protein
MQRRQARPLFLPFLLFLLLLALVGLAGCASVSEPARALGPSDGAPEDLPLVSPPSPSAPEGLDGAPLIPRRPGTGYEAASLIGRPASGGET